MTSAVTRLVTPIVTSLSVIEPSAATTRTFPWRGAEIRATAAPPAAPLGRASPGKLVFVTVAPPSAASSRDARSPPAGGPPFEPLLAAPCCRQPLAPGPFVAG